ncbi:MAG: hypothetical protein CL600_03760 [Alteromonas sp.]|nr:hypothetical protein CW735_18905 [Alteromonas sp. MB-3u-76]MAI63988.1 hypothetical protein [Alteromonas sp.]
MPIPDIHTSWQRFKIGLTIFAVGVVLLFFISHLYAVLHYFSVAVLLCGFAYAMWGYFGIFMQRFSSLKNIKPPPPQ